MTRIYRPSAVLLAALLTSGYHQCQAFLPAVAVMPSSTYTSTSRSAVNIKSPRDFSMRESRLSSVSSVAPLHYRDREDELGTNIAVASLKQKDETMLPSAPPVVQAIALSQVITLSLATIFTAGVLFTNGADPSAMSWHWNLGTEYTPLFDFSMTNLRVAEGFLATIPMVYLGRIVETSDRRDESHVNFSTMNMVMTLFGRRRPVFELDDSFPRQAHPAIQSEHTMMEVLPIAVAIALMTGISEEIVFRGEIPSLIATFSHSPVAALLGQAALFGLGHLSPKATIGENRIITGLQMLNGLWYGLIYMLAGGDVLPCIIAHCLYDSHVFMETWMSINTQMDYTEKAILAKVPKSDELEISQIQKEAGPNLNEKTLDFTRRFFYAFDYEHKGSLSQADVQRAVSYAFLQDDVQPTQKRVDKLFNGVLKRRARLGLTDEGNEEIQNRLRLPDFLRLLFVLKGKPTAA